MNLHKLIKAGGCLSSSIILLLGLSSCSTNSPAPYSSAHTPNQPSASFESSTICANNSFLQKYHCSFPQVEHAARAGDPDAQYALGYLYYYGIGTVQDRQTGLLWIRKAAAQGQPVAQQALQALSTSAKPKKSSATATATAATTTTTISSTPSSAKTSSSNNATSLSNTSTGIEGNNSGSTPSGDQPERPLTDYLPNYGEKRVDTTATPPPVNLSSPPTN